MDNWKIPLYKIFSDEEDYTLITKIIKRGDRWAIGPEIEEFEESIKNYVGSDYCLTLNSGTSALHASLLAHNVHSADEVIVPSFSFISTANSVLFVGAKPIFADIEEETLGLDPDKISNHISSQTKAIIPMDYAGMSCKIFELIDMAKKNNLVLIEDAAESLGAKVSGTKVGSKADCAIFSFCGNKVITTGEGGAVVTNSKEVYEKIKLIRSHGRTDSKNYFSDPSNPEYINLGYNWRMSSITAALGISQISKLDKIIKLRQTNANYISSRLSKISKITTPMPPENYDHIYQMYSIILQNNDLRNSLHNFLLEKRIFSKVYFEPIHLTPFYKSQNSNTSQLPVTEDISSRILTLPLYPNMTNEEKNYLIDSVSEFFET